MTVALWFGFASVANAEPEGLRAPSDATPDNDGLLTKVLVTGTGRRHPGLRDRIRIRVSSYDQATGKLIDESLAAKPTSMSQIQRETGLWRTLKLMVSGEKRRAWVPKGLTYYRSRDVVFDVELVELFDSEVDPSPPSPPSPPPQEAKLERIPIAKLPSGGLGIAASAQTAQLSPLGVYLVATKRGLGRAQSAASSAGRVYATVLPRWRVGEKMVRVLEPLPKPKPQGIPGLGFHASANTGGAGTAVTVQVPGLAGGGESLLVWDDSGNIGLADGWGWGGTSGLAGIQGGIVFQFTTASTIFDLRGATPQTGLNIGAFGANYLQGRNADGSSYWGLEFVLGTGVSAPAAPWYVPAFSAQIPSTNVIGLSDLFWDMAQGMNQMFGFHSPPFGF